MCNQCQFERLGKIYWGACRWPINSFIIIVQYYLSNLMGSDITIDKHTTGIDEWLDINDKLESTSYEEDITNHISAWKFFNDELNSQEFNSLPISLDLQNLHQLLSPHETYLVLAIKNESNEVQVSNTLPLSTLVYSIKQNIDKMTYETTILTGRLEKYSYYVYAYLGKMAKSKIRLAALSYALKMNSLLNSKKKLAILSSGGVFKNKKLQKGSTLQLISNTYTNCKETTEFQDIHIFSIFTDPPSTGNAICSFKSKRNSPFIECEEKVTTKIIGGKPPLLKLSLKPFEEIKYEEIEEEQASGEIKFDIRATARHELKMQKFEGECSEIAEGVYVSGQRVAKSWQILQKYKIKSIVNCAGDYCENWFQGKGLNYLTFFLKDSQNQNIECLFYIAIDFILNCQKNKTNVLVHCIQGVSRSITLIIAYVIFKFGYDYKKAEQFVKQKRGIACPNNGFMVQLIQFHKRLYEDYSSLPNPRVFLVSAHSKETPNLTTARMIKQTLFDSKRYVGLDSRGVYIIQGPENIYIWVGSRCEEKRLHNYWTYAQEYVKKLQKYEKGSLKVKAISQGTEGKEFFSLWNLEDIPEIYENPEYTRLFYEGETAKPGGMRKFYEKQIQEQHLNKLYIYPDYEQGLGVFEWQDLGYLNILVCSDGENLKIFICKKDSFERDEQVGVFLENIIKNSYENYEPDQIIIEQQNMEAPSEGFLTCFS